MAEPVRSLAPCHLAVSVVSHGHGPLLLQALESLAASLQGSGLKVRVWLTLNLPEPDLEQDARSQAWPFDLQLLRNRLPLGFGANHNQAFACDQSAGAGQWFVVMNPDIFWPAQAVEFWSSLGQQAWPENVGLVCPRQVDVDGLPQDFTRKLMTPWGLLRRVVARRWGSASTTGVAESVAHADWVNGACMVWRTQAFGALGGFDERYFMYCEDADICLRMRLAGWRMSVSDMSVVHDARRNTGRSWRHFRWHVRSLCRFWSSGTFWRYLGHTFLHPRQG